MRKICVFLLLCLSAFYAVANDGIFYASGNQLIPVTETDIRVKKEILTLNKVGEHIEVSVYYEFFNPADEKNLLVGFEAKAPYPPSEGIMNSYPFHSNIRNFNVIVNGESLEYSVAHVNNLSHYDSDLNIVNDGYFKDGKFMDLTRKQCKDTLEALGYNYCTFDYVYHFNAHFRKGLNIIQHTYEYDISMYVGAEYYFPYVLTAANRWANNGIDDFTLNINMGENESFQIAASFFKTHDEWTIDGKGRAATFSSSNGFSDTLANYVLFNIQYGSISFHKDNFHPTGDLYLEKLDLIHCFWYDMHNDEGAEVINCMKKQKYSLHCEAMTYLGDSVANGFSEKQKKIMRNMPFAYRGFIFKNKELDAFFKTTEWYIPNPSYDGNIESLKEEEKRWVEYWSK